MGQYMFRISPFVYRQVKFVDILFVYAANCLLQSLTFEACRPTILFVFLTEEDGRF